MKKITIFLSCVSDEFHNEDRQADHAFFSWRTALELDLNGLQRHEFVIITQESALKVAQGDLLLILEEAIMRSDYVVHLYGSLSGSKPGDRNLRLFEERCANFLSNEPELKAALPDKNNITYTQWELYFAFAGHKTRPLIYLAEETAPKSPSAEAILTNPIQSKIEKERYANHLAVIRASGQTRPRVRNQDHLCSAVKTWLITQGVFNPTGFTRATADALKLARASVMSLIHSMVRALGITRQKASNTVFPVTAKKELEIIESTAAQAGIAPSDLIEIIDDHFADVAESANQEPSAEAFSELSFTCLAIADYPRASDFARKAADHSLNLMKVEPEMAMQHRQDALNSLFLLHDALRLARDFAGAGAALEEAGNLIDRNTEPLLWAEVHQPFVEFLLDQSTHESAWAILSEIIDIREERENEEPASLAHALLTWSRLLKIEGNFQGVVAVASRAEKLYAGLTTPDIIGIANALSWQGTGYVKIPMFHEAESKDRLALEIRENALGPNHPDVAVSLNNLAELLRVTGRTPEAEPMHRRSLAIRENLLGPNHPNVALSLNNLAELLRVTGRIPEAEAMHRRALEISENVLGSNHPDVALSLNNLAHLLQATDRTTEAEPLHRRALEIRENVLGPNHPDVALSLNNLAHLLQATDRTTEAEPLHRRALEIRENVLGPNHPDVALSLNNLAHLLQATDRTTEAEPLHRRALEIRENVLGPNHPDVALSLNNLAHLLQATDRTTEAEPLHRRALEIRENVLGPNHPDVAYSLHNLGNLLVVTNRMEEAMPMLRRALDIRENTLGSNHRDVAKANTDLGLMLVNCNRHAEAEELFRRAMAIHDQLAEPCPNSAAYNLHRLGNLLKTTGRPGEAERMHRRGLAIREQAMEPDHPNITFSLSHVANLLAATDRAAEAEPLFRRAYEIRNQAHGPDHPDTVESLGELINILETNGRASEAEALRSPIKGQESKVAQ